MKMKIDESKLTYISDSAAEVFVLLNLLTENARRGFHLEDTDTTFALSGITKLAGELNDNLFNLVESNNGEKNHS